jgi:hypothetical protein
VLLAIKAGDRRVGFAVIGHFDKAKTLAPAGVTIVDDLRRQHLPVLGKELFQFRAVHLVAQISHIQLLSHLDVSCAWLIYGPVI